MVSEDIKHRLEKKKKGIRSSGRNSEHATVKAKESQSLKPQSSSKESQSLKPQSNSKESRPAEADNVPETASKATVSLGQRLWTVLKYTALVVLIPPFLNYASLQQESRLLQQNSTLYDIGFGQKLNLFCQGKGTPTVILDAPTGLSLDVWSRIQSELSSLTKVCSYDRAGLGFSQRPFKNMSEAFSVSDENADSAKWEEAWQEQSRWKEFTVERMAEDLHRLITLSSQQTGPFIMVGSELGGLVARFYTQLYDGEVSDLVLVDPLVEDLFLHDNAIWRHFWFDHLVPSFQSMQLAAATGFTRLFLLIGWMEQPFTGQLVSEEVISRQKHLLCNPRHLSTVVDEHHFINDTFSQINTLMRLKPFPSNVSVTVMTGNYYDEQLPSTLNKAWAKSQQHLISKIHPGSQHIVVNGADHRMLYRQPESIIQQIRKIIKAKRSKGILA